MLWGDGVGAALGTSPLRPSPMFWPAALQTSDFSEAFPTDQPALYCYTAK